MKEKKAELAARKARTLSRQSKKAMKIALPGKLADCSIKDGYRELWICEGPTQSPS